MILQFDAALAGSSLAIVAVKATARPATRDAARKAFGMLVTSPRSFGWPALRGFNVACRSTGLGTLSNRDVRCQLGLDDVTAGDLAGLYGCGYADCYRRPLVDHARQEPGPKFRNGCPRR